MLSGRIPNIFELWDPTSLRVSTPKDVVFVCGGPTSDPPSAVLSRRDLIMRLSRNGDFRKYRFVLAEQINALAPKENYRDILTFESDIAQISSLVLLFTESEGSFAELGAFSTADDITERMLVVIDDNYYNEDSFIKWGPIAYLENSRGDDAVYVLNRMDIGMGPGGRVTDINEAEFGRRLLNAIRTRVKSASGSSVFSAQRTGHVIRLITGLLQDYGALTAQEILLSLEFMEIDLTMGRLTEYMTSAALMGWIIRRREGLATYYAATGGREALRFEFLRDANYIDRARWRTDVLTYWQTRDIERTRVIEVARAAQ